MGCRFDEFVFRLCTGRLCSTLAGDKLTFFFLIKASLVPFMCFNCLITAGMEWRGLWMEFNPIKDRKGWTNFYRKLILLYTYRLLSVLLIWIFCWRYYKLYKQSRDIRSTLSNVIISFFSKPDIYYTLGSIVYSRYLLWYHSSLDFVEKQYGF